MYEPSRQLCSFHIAGFQFWDGALALNDLRTGDNLQLVPEPDNPHDPNAVAIYHGQTKLGFVPAEHNEELSLMLYYGHGSAFELRVLQVAPDQEPWHQVRVALYVVDAR